MQVPSDEKIEMLERLDIKIVTKYIQIDVDWFRVIQHYGIPNSEWHAHTEMEFHFVVSGSMSFNLPDRTVEVMGGQAILIPPGIQHQLVNCTGRIYKRYVLKFSLTPLSDSPEAEFLLNALNLQDARVIPIYGRVMELLEDCMREAIERIGGFMTMVETCLMMILTEVARELTRANKASYTVREKIPIDVVRMQHVQHILDTGGAMPISVDALARMLFLSTRQLQRIVQRQSGMTLHEWMMRARYVKAKELLKKPDLSIAEVAHRLGFASQQSFCRFFRKMEGEPPARYRKSAVSSRTKLAQTSAQIKGRQGDANMTNSIRPGIYPTMITPYTDDNRIDMAAVDQLVEYYAETGCDGIFALCQSSEIFFLSEEEKRALMRRVYRTNDGRMQLVASAHTASDLPTGVRQLGMMAEEGADAAVIILNRTAEQAESEDVAKANIERILNALPDVRFGIYECPYPYKRVASPDLIHWCAQTGRIVFLKDTCCRTAQLKEKQIAANGTPLTIYNANTATLLESMRLGIQGYSGIMANFHADLYVELMRLFQAGDPLADELQAFLTTASWIEDQLYPVNAKVYRHMHGMNIGMQTRAKDISLWNSTFDSSLKQLNLLEEAWRERLKMHKA